MAEANTTQLCSCTDAKRMCAATTTTTAARSSTPAAERLLKQYLQRLQAYNTNIFLEYSLLNNYFSTVYSELNSDSVSWAHEQPEQQGIKSAKSLALNQAAKTPIILVWAAAFIALKVAM